MKISSNRGQINLALLKIQLSWPDPPCIFPRDDKMNYQKRKIHADLVYPTVRISFLTCRFSKVGEGLIVRKRGLTAFNGLLTSFSSFVLRWLRLQRYAWTLLWNIHQLIPFLFLERILGIVLLWIFGRSLNYHWTNYNSGKLSDFIVVATVYSEIFELKLVDPCWFGK